MLRLRQIAAAAALVALSGCSGGPLDPKGPIAAAQRVILFDSLAIMLVIAIPTIIGAIWVVWHFRETNPKAIYEPDFAYSGRIEIVVWSIPTLVILFLGGVIWVGSHELDPSVPLPGNAKPVQVQVVSMDWKWLFIYPDYNIASVNEMVIPAGLPVHLDMTSASVLNTFWVPQLAGMVYTMNGMSSQLNLAAQDPGVFAGRSGHFSGDNFSDMHFNVRSVSASDYQKWIDAAQANGDTLDRAAYQKLSVQSVVAKPYTLRNVDPALFGAILTHQVPPGPGPDAGEPHNDVHPQTAEQ